MARSIWVLRRLAGSLRPQEAARTVTTWRAISTSGLRIERSRLRRARNALTSVVREPPSAGPIWAVAMVKNESDIIRETVQNLRDQGVDHILVADNGSSDDTAAILRDEGVMVVVDPIAEYWQGQKVTHLARAAARHGASWVIPFDADELWKGKDGDTVADILHSSDANVMEAEWWDFVPLAEGDSAAVATRYPWRLPQPDRQSKQAFRANWLARVTLGSHQVHVPGARSTRGLRIAHYRARSVEQMVRKARDGAAASRRAGIASNKLPQWFEVTDEASARARLESMTSGELVRDPSSNW